jgi:molybdopterin molybdotransferase
MRPGKPLIFGRLNAKPFLGLPGNPVSSYVCALLFLKPLIAGLLGVHFRQTLEIARVARALAANDSRQDYIRARLFGREGEWWVEPFAVQDSSVQSALAAADALIVRPPHTPAVVEGDPVAILPLTDD